MLLGEELFPGETEQEQLNLIYAGLGTDTLLQIREFKTWSSKNQVFASFLMMSPNRSV